MNTLSPTLAHKELVSRHQTMRWISDNGSVSVRKTAGRFVVRVEDFTYDKVTTNSYATLKGALVAADNLRNYYL